MVFKILDTTDNKHEGEIFEFDGHIVPGGTINYKDVNYSVDSVKWLSSTVVQIISSNYIAILKVIGK